MEPVKFFINFSIVHKKGVILKKNYINKDFFSNITKDASQKDFTLEKEKVIFF